jgi:hypothetical protein
MLIQFGKPQVRLFRGEFSVDEAITIVGEQKQAKQSR